MGYYLVSVSDDGTIVVLARGQTQKEVITQYLIQKLEEEVMPELDSFVLEEGVDPLDVAVDYVMRDLSSGQVLLIPESEFNKLKAGKKVKVKVVNMKKLLRKNKEFIKGFIAKLLMGYEGLKESKKLKKLAEKSSKGFRKIGDITKESIKVAVIKYADFQYQVLTEGLADAFQNLEDENLNKASVGFTWLLIILLVVMIAIYAYYMFYVKHAPLFNI